MTAGTQRVDDTLTWFFDFAGECYRYREPGRVYATNDVVRPATPNGYEYKATTGGQTRGTLDAPRPPIWPTSGTVTDGSVVWTPQAISSSGLLRTLASKAVETDTGLTAVSSAIVNQAGRQGVTVQLESATAGTYACRVRATFSDGEDAELVLSLTITE